MQYISPFHNLPSDVLANGLTDTNKIKLARKKLLAEIELSDTNSVFINNKELTKSDVLEMFDSLNNANTLAVHQSIFSDKALLAFLENNIEPTTFNFTEQENLATKDAIDFVSPYYKTAALKLVTDATNKKNIGFFKKYFSSEHILTGGDAFIIFDQISKRLLPIADQIKVVEKKIEDKKEISHTDIDALNLETNIGLLNCLPDDFSKLKDTVGGNLNGLGCDLINNSYNKFATELYSLALKLDCANDTKNYFVGNLKIAKNNKLKFPKNFSLLARLRHLVYYSNGKLVVNITLRQVWLTLIFLFFARNIIVGMFKTPDTKSSAKTHFTIGALNTDEPSDKAHYPAASKADSNFNNFMYMLAFQDNPTANLGTTEIKFKKGDNVYASFFRDSDFTLKRASYVGTGTLEKTIWVINNTMYSCVLIIRNLDIKSNDELVTNYFKSYYLPKYDSLNIKLEEGFNDIRPYMGIKLVRNIFSNNDVSFSKNDIFPPYLFEQVPKHSENLMGGIGIKFNVIKDAGKLVFAQDSTGRPYTEIGGFTQ